MRDHIDSVFRYALLYQGVHEDAAQDNASCGVTRRPLLPQSAHVVKKTGVRNRIVDDDDVWYLRKVGLQSRCPGMHHRINDDVRHTLSDGASQPSRRPPMEIR